MNYNNMSNDIKLYENFRKKWSLEKIKNLKLEEYAKVNSKSSFVYDIEHTTKSLGKIRVSSSFVFGIYEQQKKEYKKTSQSTYNGKYAWEKKFGNNEEEAFNNVKADIISIITNAQAGNYSEIENSRLNSMYRWKIAFLYQDPKHPMITPVYTKAVLEWDIERKGININNPRRSQLYTTIGEYEKFSDLEHILSYGRDLWADYNETNSSDYDANFEKKIIKNSNFSKKRKRNATTSSEYVEYIIKEHKIIRRNPHNKLEQSNKKYLSNVVNVSNIVRDSDFIDYQFNYNSKKYICELKPSSNQTEIKYAIQSAIGQILRYSYEKEFDVRIIVFQKEPKDENLKFLEYLYREFNLYYLYEKSYGKFKGNILN